jgi:hypothetical protein
MVKTKFGEGRQARGLVGSIKKNIFNLKNLNKILCVLLVVLGVVYIIGVNDLAIKGFALSDLKGQQSKIADENKRLELKAMTLSSYNVIGEKIDNLKMVAVGEVEYVAGGSGMVAKN